MSEEGTVREVYAVTSTGEYLPMVRDEDGTYRLPDDTDPTVTIRRISHWVRAVDDDDQSYEEEEYEPDWHRFYKCGCAPDEEQFCNLMDGFVWAERDAFMEWSMDVAPEPEAQRRIAMARTQMRIHLGWQEAAGLYEDVDFNAPEMQPPDEDYDETILGR